MKQPQIGNITRGLLAALFALVIGVSAQAGPGGHEAYMPVKTMAQAQSIKPGERVAISCGNCGAFTLFTADKERSYLHGYTCETCKKKFVARTDAHGGLKGSFVYEDEAGHQSQLLRGR